MSTNNLRRSVPSFTMSSMDASKQGGYVSGALVGLIVTSVLLVAALGFGGWAFMSRQDYKLRSDDKVKAAVDKAVADTQAKDAVKYAEEAKNPLKTYKGLDQFGAITVQYPKTWSAYVVETSKGGTPVDDYFHPDVVPGVGNDNNAFALRIEVVDQAYDRIVDSFRSNVETNKVTAAPYTLPKVPSVVGTRFDGQIQPNKQGSMIVLPMRNMTLKIWTESSSFSADFNNIILANLVFSP